MCHEGCVQQWLIMHVRYIYNRHEALPEDNNLVAVIIELLQLLRHFLAEKLPIGGAGDESALTFVHNQGAILHMFTFALTLLW